MKVKATTYTFTKGGAGVGTILFTGPVIPSTLDQILIVQDATTGTMIYNPFDATKLGTFSGATLTLAADTSALNNADKLLIFVDDGLPGSTVQGRDIDNAAQTANTKPISSGGVAVDVTTPNAYTVGDAVQMQFDKNNGALLATIGNLDSSKDTITNTPAEVVKTTYTASFTGVVAAATGTDLVDIIGSATKTVRIKRIELSGIAGAAVTIDVLIAKRSTANSGGTSTTLTGVPHDSGNAAATAVSKAYTANPTTGTLVGYIKSKKVILTTAATPAIGSDVVIEFGLNGNQNVILRGVAQALAINLNGATTGGTFNGSITWTEE